MRRRRAGRTGQTDAGPPPGGQVPPAPGPMPPFARFDSFAAAEEPWRRLALETGNVFSTWEWAETWWRHFGKHRRLSLLKTSGADGEAVAILPLYVEPPSLPGRIMRLVGHGVADQLGPVCRPADSGALARVLDVIGADGGVFIGERLPAVRAWETELDGRVLKADVSPTIVLAQEGGWESYVAARSAKFRAEVRRTARRLKRLGVSYRLADETSLSRDLDALMALHRARWQGKGKSNAFTPRREAFHRDFALAALREGWLRLWIAEAAGVPVAAWHGFRFAGVDSFYQAGRDPGWDRERVGGGLLEHSIRQAFEDDMREFRFLRGGEAYKNRYCNRVDEVKTIAAGQRAFERALIGAVAALAPVTRRRLAELRSKRRPVFTRGLGVFV